MERVQAVMPSVTKQQETNFLKFRCDVIHISCHLQVVQRFRQGGYNTLVATCVGEEGLDIGEVDLIVCFDAHASPIRLVQRMGRTGRKRDGRIVILVTEGIEEQVHRTVGYM